MKNAEIKNLRVAVVPVKDSNIDQRSSTKEILACPLTELFPITDYFQSQNDEELPESYWTFLLDFTNPDDVTDITGSNIDGIHQFDKASKIAVIKRILEVWGGTSTMELELGCSPCISSIGNGKQNVCQLIETFNVDCVRAVTYNDEIELGETDIKYEDLSDELIEEIHKIMLDYEIQMSEE